MIADEFAPDGGSTEDRLINAIAVIQLHLSVTLLDIAKENLSYNRIATQQSADLIDLKTQLLTKIDRLIELQENK